MADTVDLGQLVLTRGTECCRFTLAAPTQPVLELPANLERQLGERLANLLAAGDRPAVVLDLEGIPAISSRQLGVMLTLSKVLRDSVPRLPLKGVSGGVRRLLEVTRTDQFFEIT